MPLLSIPDIWDLNPILLFVEMSLQTPEFKYITGECLQEWKGSNAGFKLPDPVPMNRFLYELCWSMVSSYKYHLVSLWLLYFPFCSNLTSFCCLLFFVSRFVGICLFRSVSWRWIRWCFQMRSGRRGWVLSLRISLLIWAKMSVFQSYIFLCFD